MDNLSISKYFWTALLALGGFLMYKILSPFFLDPIKEFRNWKGKVAQTLIEYGNVFGPLANKEENQVARKLFKELRGEGDRIVSQIPWYGFFSRLGVLPDRNSLEIALTSLNGLSNCGVDELSAEHSARYEKRLRCALKLGNFN